MYGVLKSHITIAGIDFTQVNELKVTKSVDLLSDTAVIKMPTSFLLASPDGFTKKTTEKTINVGDEVRISLGYDGIIYQEEFVGYVKAIKPTIPLEIECEDAIFKIRREKTITRLFVKAQLREVLEEIVSGTGIGLSGEIPKLQLDRFYLKNVNGAQALSKIKEEFGLAIYIDDSGKLFAGLQQQLNADKTVYYHFQRNVLPNTQLEFTKAEDQRLKIKAVGIAPDNTRIDVEVGDQDGEARTLFFYNISDKAKLKEIAESQLELLRYTGYKGTLTAFGYPDAQRGWAADLVDGNYPERAGRYFVEQTVLTNGTGGIRREVTIGKKI